MPGGHTLGGAPLVTPPYQPAQEMLIDATQDDNDNPLYATDDFRMLYYKITPCAKRFVHDWTTCPFSHPGEKARRRDPRVTQYTGIACPDMKKTGSCARGDRCPYAHQVFEYWLNYTRYRTQLCNDGPKCRRRVCFFAHTMEELRTPPVKPYVAPEYLAALAAETQGRKGAAAGTPDTPFGMPGTSPTSSGDPHSVRSAQRSRSSQATSSGGDPRPRGSEPDLGPTQPLFAQPEQAPTDLQLLVSHLHTVLKGPQRSDTIAVVSSILKDAVQADMESPSADEASLNATAASVFGRVADASFDAPWPGPGGHRHVGRSGSSPGKQPVGSLQVGQAPQRSAGLGSGPGAGPAPHPSLDPGNSLAQYLHAQRGAEGAPGIAETGEASEEPLPPPNELASAAAALARTPWPQLPRDHGRQAHHLSHLPQQDRLSLGLPPSMTGPPRPGRRSLSSEHEHTGGLRIADWQSAEEISSALANMGMKGDLARLTTVLQQASRGQGQGQGDPGDTPPPQRCSPLLAAPPIPAGQGFQGHAGSRGAVGDAPLQPVRVEGGHEKPPGEHAQGPQPPLQAGPSGHNNPFLMPLASSPGRAGPAAPQPGGSGGRPGPPQQSPRA